MSDGLNRVLLFGNLGADPELKMTSGGQAVLKMRLATAESYLDRNKQRQEKTEWHSVVLWGKRAEALSKFLSKGARIFVEGSLSTSSWDDKDGTKRYRTEVKALNIILAGGPRGSKQASSGADDDDDAAGYTRHPEPDEAKAPAEDFGDLPF